MSTGKDTAKRTPPRGKDIDTEAGWPDRKGSPTPPKDSLEGGHWPDTKARKAKRNNE